MAISNESKQAIRKEINQLNRKKRILDLQVRELDKTRSKLQASVDSVSAEITKLESDL